MTRTRFSGAALAALALAGVVASAQPAEAGWRCGPYGRCVHRPGGIGPGAAAALGVVGGVALGAAIASAAQPVYAAPVYVAPPPVCTVHRNQVWNGWNWEVRSRQVCR